MDRLLAWCDLEVTIEGVEGAAIPTELWDEIRARESAFIMDQPRPEPPLLMVRFVVNRHTSETRAVVLRESDLYGTIGENVDSILRTGPEDRPDILVMRGTL